MRIAKKEYFKKLTIEDVKYFFKEDNTFVVTEWTGYGIIQLPFHKSVPIKRGTRKPQFNWSQGRVVYQVDMREFLKDYLLNKDREEQEIINQEAEERYNKEDDQMITKFNNFDPEIYENSRRKSTHQKTE